jgi:hypothetical protein
MINSALFDAVGSTDKLLDSEDSKLIDFEDSVRIG